MEYGEELYAERLRRKTQAEDLASGLAQWTEKLNDVVRLKLSLAWEDATKSIPNHYYAGLEPWINDRTIRSLGVALGPDAMKAPSGTWGTLDCSH